MGRADSQTDPVALSRVDALRGSIYSTSATAENAPRGLSLTGLRCIVRSLVPHADGRRALEQALGGAVDPRIIEVCRLEGRALVTLDLDFANIHR